MKRLAVLTIFLLLAGATPASAHMTVVAAQVSTVAPGVGLLCYVASTTDVPRVDPGWQIGALGGGPVVTPIGQPATLSCSLQLNTSYHSAPDTVTRSADGDDGVIVLPPQPVEYRATAAEEVYLCSALTIGDETYYWESEPIASTGRTGRWSTNANGSCGSSITVEPEAPECSVWHYVDRTAGTDLASTWEDCEPYDPLDPCPPPIPPGTCPEVIRPSGPDQA